MKFVCNGTFLSEAAFTVSKACASKTTMPVLECIKIKAKNDIITLTAYDGEMSIEKKIKAEVVEEGELCVNGKLFSDFVGKISLLDVVLDSEEEKGLTIRYGDNETYMQTLPGEDFPDISGNEAAKDKFFEIKESALKDIISKVVFCCATDESRPILKGCLLEAKDGKLFATALDGFRMACSYCDAVSEGGDMKLVCPARTLTEIARMLNGDENTLKIYADKNRLSVEIDDTVVTSRLYVGEFVRKENIFPVDFATVLTTKRSALVASLERASVVMRGDRNNLVIFDIKSGKATVSANSDMGKVEETVEAKLSGKELKIAMNGKFLAEAVKALTDEEIVISFNSSVSPFTIENIEDKRCQYLVLPVRTSSSAQ